MGCQSSAAGAQRDAQQPSWEERAELNPGGKASDRQVPAWPGTPRGTGTGLPAGSETPVPGSPERDTWRCPVGMQTGPLA